MKESMGAARPQPPLLQAAYWAGAAPLLCAVHCLAMPLAVLLAPWLAPARQTEWALLLGSAVLAVAFTVHGVRIHGRRSVWLPIALGVAACAASLGLPAEGPGETAAVVSGSLLLAGGLLLNARYRHAVLCRRCACPVHGGE